MPNIDPFPAGTLAPGQRINSAYHNDVADTLRATQATANSAFAQGGGSGGALAGVVELDSFTGLTDDVKLTNALSYAAAQTLQPYIMFPARVVTLSQRARVPFNGMRLVGPGFAPGPKNLELASGKYVNHRVSLSGIGTGVNSLFVSSGSVYNIYVSGLAFQGSNVQQFWDHITGTLYACEFNSLTFYGLSSVFGDFSAGRKCLMTQVFFSGHWQVIAYDGSADVQFYIGGSDNEFWNGGYVNLGPGAASNAPGRFQVVFDSMFNTNVGKIYCTSNNGWLGIRVTGNGQQLNFIGTISEGYKASGTAGEVCDGAVYRVDGGGVAFVACGGGQGMGNPAANGVNSGGMWDIRGGNVLIDRPTYWRATAVSETVPMVYASGGVVSVRDAHGYGTWSGLPRVQNAGATVRTDASVTVI